MMDRVEAEVDLAEVRAPRGPTSNTVIEDEDDLLYGESAPSLFPAAVATVAEPLTSAAGATPVFNFFNNSSSFLVFIPIFYTQ